MIIRRMKPLREAVNEALAKDASPEDYRASLQDEFLDGAATEQGRLVLGDVYHNPPEEDETSKRNAYGDIPWIEYWRRMTGFEGNHLKCSFCSKDIYINVDAFDAYEKQMDAPKPDKDTYQAVGGHFHKNGHDAQGGYIILPICKSCNSRARDYDLVVQEENAYVEEVGAHKQKGK